MLRYGPLGHDDGVMAMKVALDLRSSDGGVNFVTMSRTRD